ncbi:serine hydrolase [Symbiobacterium terraclitae]|uniref:serine hydrolase n=1 Tax=Symbiobacterium terraclitae TaxID=557451 RepID=UPI0035B50E07
MARRAPYLLRTWLCLMLSALMATGPAAAAAGLTPTDAVDGSGSTSAREDPVLTSAANGLPVGSAALAGGDGDGPSSRRQSSERSADVVRRIEEITRWAPGLISVWYYDLSTHERFGVKADEVHTAASTVKVLIATYLYHLAATGQVSLDEKVAILPVDWKDGSGVLNGVPEGTRFTRRELSRLMLVHSDNTAANALMRTLGVQKMVQYYRSLGIRYGGPHVHTPQQLWQHNRIAPEDLGIVLRNVWEAAQRSPEPWAEMLSFMRESRSKGRIPGGLPPGLPVANKTGSKGTSFHDAAIVLDRRPYVLVVMTEGMTAKEASYYIASVSREVWRWHSRRAAVPPAR